MSPHRQTYRPSDERIEQRRAAAMNVLTAIALGLMLAAFIAYGTA